MRNRKNVAIVILLIVQAGSATQGANALDCRKELADGNKAIAKKYGKMSREIFARLIKSCPPSADTRFGMGMALKIDGLNQQSVKYFRQALALNPQHIEAMIELAEVLTWNDNTRAEGIRLLQDALSIRPTARAKKLLGTTLSWPEESRSQAMPLLLDYVKTNPGDSEAWLTLGRLQNSLADPISAEKSFTRAIALNKNDFDSIYELAMVISSQPERREQALVFLNTVIKGQPQNHQARFVHAMILGWMGRYTESISELRKLRETHPALTWKDGVGEHAKLSISLSLARVLSWDRQYKEAEEILNSLIATDASNKSARRELAVILSYQEDRRQDALPTLMEVVKANPQDDDAILALVQVHIANKNAELAEPLLKQLLARNPKLASAHKLSGDLHAEQAEHREAIAEYENAKQLGLLDVDTAYGLAVSYLAVGDAVSSETVSRQAPPTVAEDSRMQVTLARALIAQKRPDEAIEILRGIMQCNQIKELAKVSEEFASDKSTRSFSIELCRKVLVSDPNNQHCLSSLGKVLSWDEKKREEGLLLLKRYIELYPNDLETRRYHAEVTSWTGKKKQALALYDELLSLEPLNNNIRASRAQVLSWMGRVSASIKEYKQVLENDSKHKESLIGLGQCLNWQGDNLKSEKVFAKAVAIYPDAPDVVLERALNFQRMGRADLALRGALTCIELFEANGYI